METESQDKEISKERLFDLLTQTQNPMYSKDITMLRKNGNLTDALELSDKALSEEPDNIWNKRAAAWVHFDYLKKYNEAEEFERFKKHLLKIKALDLPVDEKMLFDQCAWKIGSMVFAIQHTTPVNIERINALFDIIKVFHFTKASEAYSFIYKAFQKINEQWSKYLEFADWWDFENFLPEDFLEEEYQGKKIMALVEQAYIAYAKKLLKGKALDGFGTEYEIDKNKIQEFLPKMDALIDSHPEYLYPPYFKAKMLIALGGTSEDVLTTFRPFAKKKRNMFWVWELMAEIFAENSELSFACYCKALSLDTPEDYIVKLRQSFAAILVAKKMYVAAKTEIEKAISTRNGNGWRLTGQITQWTEQEWYQATKSKIDNSDLYAAHLMAAEEILFADIPETTVAVEFVNHGKSTIHFVRDKEVNGFFKYDKKVLNPKTGDLLMVRLGKVSSNGFFKIFTSKLASENDNCDAVRDFEGDLKIISPYNFGFADDVFIHQNIIKDYKLKEGQKVKGKAVLSFNKKKNEWGWKGVRFR